MVTTESVTIQMPVGMSKYLKVMNTEMELIRNALLLYPYILNLTISHGGAAEILGIRKSELLDIYDRFGYDNGYTSFRTGRHIGQKHYQLLLDKLSE